MNNTLYLKKFIIEMQHLFNIKKNSINAIHQIKGI